MGKVIKKGSIIETPKAKYKLSNWPSYNKSLVNRGNVTIWISDQVINSWYYDGDRLPGGVLCYSDSTILFCLTIRGLYHLGYRQTQGFISGLLKLMELELEIPHYSQLHRRSRDLEVDIRISNRWKGRLDVVLDASGLKVYGEGEWKVRKYGLSKRRTWRKLHLCTDTEDLEILSVVVRGNNVDDAQAGIELIDQLEDPINSCCGDGAYDKKKFRCHLPNHTIAVIPPQHNGRISNEEDQQLKHRDQAIRDIDQIGLKQWKKQTGYHKRSLSEVNFYRYKTIFGDKLRAREPDYEHSEVSVKCRILNQFTAIGMPKSYKVDMVV